MKTDNRVDTYIEKSADFAKPVLNHLRQLVHECCPEVKEDIKWGMPSFDHCGIMVNMAAFKAHCAFGFWKARIMSDPKGILKPVGNTGMGNFGKISSLQDLPPDQVIRDYIMEAMRLNEEGVKVPTVKKDKKDLILPGDLKKALQSRSLTKAFSSLSYSHQKEYITWIEDAKREETRQRRIEKAVGKMEDGRSLHDG